MLRIRIGVPPPPSMSVLGLLLVVIMAASASVNVGDAKAPAADVKTPAADVEKPSDNVKIQATHVKTPASDVKSPVDVQQYENGTVRLKFVIKGHVENVSDGIIWPVPKPDEESAAAGLKTSTVAVPSVAVGKTPAASTFNPTEADVKSSAVDVDNENSTIRLKFVIKGNGENVSLTWLKPEEESARNRRQAVDNPSVSSYFTAAGREQPVHSPTKTASGMAETERELSLEMGEASSSSYYRPHRQLDGLLSSLITTVVEPLGHTVVKTVVEPVVKVVRPVGESLVKAVGTPGKPRRRPAVKPATPVQETMEEPAPEGEEVQGGQEEQSESQPESDQPASSISKRSVNEPNHSHHVPIDQKPHGNGQKLPSHIKHIPRGPVRHGDAHGSNHQEESHLTRHAKNRPHYAGVYKRAIDQIKYPQPISVPHDLLHLLPSATKNKPYSENAHRKTGSHSKRAVDQIKYPQHTSVPQVLHVGEPHHEVLQKPDDHKELEHGVHDVQKGRHTGIHKRSATIFHELHEHTHQVAHHEETHVPKYQGHFHHEGLQHEANHHHPVPHHGESHNPPKLPSLHDHSHQAHDHLEPGQEVHAMHGVQNEHHGSHHTDIHKRSPPVVHKPLGNFHHVPHHEEPHHMPIHHGDFHEPIHHHPPLHHEMIHHTPPHHPPPHHPPPHHSPSLHDHFHQVHDAHHQHHP